MSANADVILFGLGLGVLGATGQDIAAFGLDGLNLLLLTVGILLVYFGGKRVLGSP